ncbi:MAG TPA: aldo/keto reductase [Candidatus Limiplasma sp.]|nr:aldo/keto reductase [Candidatus Limiplasma sp.]HPR78364.1 aldo/keto reductase [Candidatus Limiplasma sp.]
METIKLKGTSLTVSRLCMGGCPAGEYGWGNVSRAEVEHAMLHALELGVNFFDTADTYGLGRSEETLGETLAAHRGEVVFATKFGVRVENGHTFYDNSPTYIAQALAASLKRLHTDHIDLYQVHYLDGHTPIPTLMESLIAHREKGDILAIGLSNITPEALPELLPYRDYIAGFQNHFSLAHRDDEAAMLQTAQSLAAAPLTWGSLGQGILTGKYGADVHFDANDRRSRPVYDNFYGDKLQKNLKIVEAMRPIAKAHGVPVSAVAVRWILDELPGSVVITGVKSPAQAEANAAAMSFALSPDERATLTEISK